MVCHFTPFVGSCDELLSLGKEATELVKSRLLASKTVSSCWRTTYSKEEDLEFLQRELALDYYSILKMGQAKYRLSKETSGVTKLLEYPLIALTLTKKQCDDIERPIVLQLLASSGLSKSFPRVVLDGPKLHNGMGRQGMFFNQGKQHIDALIKHSTRESSITGQYFRGLIEQHNLELGTGTSILKSPYLLLHQIVTDSWMKHT
eukprot:scaffold88952_cov32-Attheya_sp.AAC.2